MNKVELKTDRRLIFGTRTGYTELQLETNMCKIIEPFGVCFRANVQRDQNMEYASAGGAHDANGYRSVRQISISHLPQGEFYYEKSGYFIVCSAYRVFMERKKRREEWLNGETGRLGWSSRDTTSEKLWVSKSRPSFEFSLGDWLGPLCQLIRRGHDETCLHR